MPDYTYPSAPVLEETTGEFAIGATGLLRNADGDTVAMYDLNGSVITSITVGPKGAHPGFMADIPHGVLDFGSVRIVALSVEAMFAAIEVQQTAESALSQVEQMQTSKAPILHTHAVDDLEATGTPSSFTFLRGDGTWSVPAGGSGGGTGFLDGGSATSTFSDLVIDGGTAA